jgi:hypothetical protein
MKTKTLKQLRDLAKARGLKGYTRLAKLELVRLLARVLSAAKKLASKTAKAKSSKKKQRAAPAANKTVVRRRAWSKSPAREPSPTVGTPALSDEQRVETAKFAVTPPGVAFSEPAFGPDLGEDIDRLPALSEPMLCLLPQKPGILHGYWWLPPGMFHVPATHMLRLGRLVGETLEIVQEFPLPQANGRWYFQLDATVDTGALYLQLGYYQADGSFVSAIRRGISRIPSLYASERTDRRWWVSDAQFRAMYLRAGGFPQGTRLGWTASIGSPGAQAVSPGRLVWPGGNLSS